MTVVEKQNKLVDELIKLRQENPGLAVKVLVDTEYCPYEYRWAVQTISRVMVVPWLIVDDEKILTSEDEIEQWFLERNEEDSEPTTDIDAFIADKISSAERVIAIYTVS